jgi:DNA polymerase-3 subunit epsilon
VPSDQLVTVVDPQTRVRPGILKLTGITERQIEAAEPFGAVAGPLARLIEDADLAGYHIHGYDRPLLEAEYRRLGEALPGPGDRTIVDAYQLEQALSPRTLSNTYQKYVGEPLDGAHDAARDAKATWAVLQGQCTEYGLDGSSAQDLANRARGDFLDAGRKLKETSRGVELCFGKHEGKTLAELEDEHPGYLEWMYGEITELQPHIDRALGRGAA